VLAHPDDETLGFGGTLARYAAEGVEVHLLTATRGEGGRFGRAGRNGDPIEVGQVRERELRDAARILGISRVSILGYPDGRVDQVLSRTAVCQIASHIRCIRPDVLVTFGPDGAYGHPDHIAISQFATAATICAADAKYGAADEFSTDSPPYRVPKLYSLAWPRAKWQAYEAAFRKLTSTIDGLERQSTPWPDWAVTTCLDTSAYSKVVWSAVQCHQTQISIYDRLAELSEEQHQALWGSQHFYRVYSTVNGGRKMETDVFEGLR
jgi:LmbE family N-acetylglucosaminyl deacetylase